MLSRKSRRFSRPTSIDAELRRKLALAFHDAAQRPFCSSCHRLAAPLHAHHFVEASFIRRELRSLNVPELRIEALAYDTRNCGGFCDVCHGGHHGPSLRSRITSAHVPESAWEFARELDALAPDQRFTARLERMYRNVAEAA